MELETPRLKMAKMTAADGPDYVHMVGVPAVMQHITGNALAPAKAWDKFQTVLEENARYPEFGFFSLRKKADTSYIGLAKLTWMGTGKAEIGYSLLPDHWRQKYTTEVVSHLIDYTRQLHSVHTLVALVAPENEASKAILTKFGFYRNSIGTYQGMPTEYYYLGIRK